MRCLYSAPCMRSRLPKNISSSLRTLMRFANFPTISQSEKFSDPPQLSDLDGFTLEADDIKH